MTYFLENKYSLWYCNLIKKAKNRLKIDGYSERHHIIPRSLGGMNTTENLALLTGREHLIAHKLLVRITAGDFRKKMLGALWAMASMRNKFSKDRALLSSREFDTLRKDFFESRRGNKHTASTKEKLRKANLGKKVPKEVIQKRSRTLKANLASGGTVVNRKKISPEKMILRNRKYSESMTDSKRKASVEKAQETRAAWSQDFRDAYAKNLSQKNRHRVRTTEQRQNIVTGLLARNYSHSAQTRKKIGESTRGTKRETVMAFVIKDPTGQILRLSGKAKDVCETLGIGVKYFYLSLKLQKDIQRGPGAGFQLLQKTRTR